MGQDNDGTGEHDGEYNEDNYEPHCDDPDFVVS
jgi:hypothetical protein